MGQLIDQSNNIDTIVDNFPFLVGRLQNWPERQYLLFPSRMLKEILVTLKPFSTILKVIPH